MNDKESLLLPKEVAALFRVDPKTASRWAQAKKIGSVMTPGGHRRFRRSEVEELIISSYTPRVAKELMDEMEKIVSERES